MVSNLTEALPCPKFTLFKTKAYLSIIKINHATDDHGALHVLFRGYCVMILNYLDKVDVHRTV